MGFALIATLIVVVVGLFIGLSIGYVTSNKKKMSKISDLSEQISELKSSSDALSSIIEKLNTDKKKLQDELGDARKEIWDYEMGDKSPVQKVRINEMKEYIFHLLQKQSVVLGLNEQDKKWVRKLGGQIQKEANDE